MESHIQAWFVFNPEGRTKGNILASYENESKVDLENFKFGKQQVLVQVKRVGARSKTKDSQWLHLAVDDEIKAKIREWIANEKTFDPDKVNMSEEEALVIVRGESCTHTSHGLDCDCK